uniref:Uncharacterized protein n=1 Tax=Anopheles atroparvus TaxID=41427 RepID=A0A182J9B9_ANOAO
MSLFSAECEEYQQVTLFPTSIEFESNNCTNEVKPIPGGEVTKYGEFPHHVLLGYPKKDGEKECEEYQQVTLFPTRIEFESNNCTNEVKPIPGGEVTKYGEFPHHVLLGYPKKDGEKGT